MEYTGVSQGYISLTICSTTLQIADLNLSNPTVFPYEMKETKKVVAPETYIYHVVCWPISWFCSWYGLVLRHDGFTMVEQVKIKRSRAWVILFSVFCKQRWEFNMRVVLVENAWSVQSGKNSSSRENECYETISGKSSFKIFRCLAFRTIDIYTRLIENLIIYFQGIHCFLDRGLPKPSAKYGPQGAKDKSSM